MERAITEGTEGTLTDDDEEDEVEEESVVLYEGGPQRCRKGDTGSDLEITDDNCEDDVDKRVYRWKRLLLLPEKASGSTTPVLLTFGLV